MAIGGDVDAIILWRDGSRGGDVDAIIYFVARRFARRRASGSLASAGLVTLASPSFITDGVFLQFSAMSAALAMIDNLIEEMSTPRTVFYALPGQPVPESPVTA